MVDPHSQTKLKLPKWKRSTLQGSLYHCETCFLLVIRVSVFGYMLVDIQQAFHGHTVCISKFKQVSVHGMDTQPTFPAIQEYNMLSKSLFEEIANRVDGFLRDSQSSILNVVSPTLMAYLKELPMGPQFTSQVDKVLSHPPEFYSHSDQPHLNGMLESDEIGCKSEMNLAEQISLIPGI